jgi:hypothetical protein
MEHSPSWEADSHSASREIRRILCNPNVYYRVKQSPLLIPILSHIFLPYFSKIHSNIILPSDFV